MQLKKELVKWRVGLEKLSLIQPKQKHGKCEEYIITRKESSACVRLNLQSRPSRTTHVMSIHQDKTGGSQSQMAAQMLAIVSVFQPTGESYMKREYVCSG